MQTDHDEIFGGIPAEPIDDATALQLRDGIVESMIADACQWVPPFRVLCLAGQSPQAHLRAVPIKRAEATSVLLKSGLKLGVLDALGAGRVRTEGRA